MLPVSPDPVRHVERLDASWLTGVLTASGALTAGSVERVTRERIERRCSTLVRLTPLYSRHADGVLPRSLFVKLCAGSHAILGYCEVDYYVKHYVDSEHAPLPRCYWAAYDRASGDYALVLEDLSATHSEAHDIDEAYALAAATSIAQLHAHRWGPARLARVGELAAEATDVARYVGHIALGIDRGCALAPRHERTLRELFDHVPRALLDRAGDPRDLTLLHGDTSPGNILQPRLGFGRAYLIDRQPFAWSLRVWLGAYDLAYMMVLFWDPVRRRALQASVLHTYLAQLQRAGVTYDADALARDYTLAVAQCVMYAVEWLGRREYSERMRDVWLSRLDWALEAYREVTHASAAGAREE